MAVEREQGLSKKQMERAYKNYQDRYEAQAQKMRNKGLAMHDKRELTFSEYKMTRRAFVDELRAAGRPIININQTIVSKQQYEFSMEQARGIREAGSKLGLDLQSQSLVSIRGGRKVRNEDLSLINNALKEEYPQLSGVERAQWIKENIFGDSL